MEQLREHAVSCPYCGELIWLLVDLSAGSSDYIEDCSVCCRPLEIRLQTSVVGDFELMVRRDDEI